MHFFYGDGVGGKSRTKVLIDKNDHKEEVLRNTEEPGVESDSVIDSFMQQKVTV